MKPNHHDDKPKRQSNWRERIATPQRLADLFIQQGLPESAWQPAQALAGFVPTKKEWLRYLNLILTGLGTIFILAGIVFFFAFNWDDLGRFQRFAVVEGAVIITTLLAFVLNLDKWAGKLALAASSILLGVALAVVGQEYQTGADSYRLFMIWTMLITGWVLISRWNVMYLIWMILLNVTITLYWEQVIYSDWSNLNLILLAINASFVFLWEIIGSRTQWSFMTEGRWFLYLLMTIALGHATSLAVDAIFGSIFTDGAQILQPIAYVVLIGLTVAYFSIIKRDLLMITLASFSLLIVTIAGAGQTLSDVISDGIAFFFMMTIITIGTTSLMAIGLRILNQRWEVDYE
ncbi:MAG: DUF2157 domain-containing protein [Chloroflexota bacterium]